MKKIYVLYLHALKVELYFTFMLHVVEIIDKFEVINTLYKQYVDTLKAAFRKLNSAYLKYDPNFYTKQLQEADEKRSMEFRRMREALRYMCIYSPDDEKKLAAERLVKITDLYGGGDIATQNKAAKTAAITNIIEDFEEKNPEELETTGISPQLEALKQAQAKYDEIYMQRVEYDSEIGKGLMDEARKCMDEAYRDLVTIINIDVKHDTNGELTNFINMLNVEISRNRTYTGQGQVDSNNTGTGSLETDEDDLRLKNVTFKFIGGNEQKFRLEVGAPLEALENTPGYKWDKEVPEFMPNRNIVFREVPIEEAEFTATFHFLDHHDEEIRQLAGTALVAPPNTDGCVWDPTVPATMPAEDTQYYEVLDNGGGGEGTGGSGEGTGGNGGSTGSGGGVIYPGEPGEDTDLY